MLIAPGFVPEGGGIDWSNVTASSLLGLEPGAAVVEGEVGLEIFLALKSFLVKRGSFMSCEISRQNSKQWFFLESNDGLIRGSLSCLEP